MNCFILLSIFTIFLDIRPTARSVSLLGDQCEFLIQKLIHFLNLFLHVKIRCILSFLSSRWSYLLFLFYFPPLNIVVFITTGPVNFINLINYRVFHYFLLLILNSLYLLIQTFVLKTGTLPLGWSTKILILII
jgi:hypothetical protein